MALEIAGVVTPNRGAVSAMDIPCSTTVTGFPINGYDNESAGYSSGNIDMNFLFCPDRSE